MDFKTIHNKALKKFVAENPDVKNEIDSLSAAKAGALGISLEELKSWKLNERFSEYAALLGTSWKELNFQLGLESETERQTARIQSAKQVAEHLGMLWEEYVELNPHLKAGI